MRTLTISESLAISAGTPDPETLLNIGLSLLAAAAIAEIGFFGYCGYQLAIQSGYMSGYAGALTGVSTFAGLIYLNKTLSK